MRNFSTYNPTADSELLHLDGVTLANLDILSVNGKASAPGSLLHYLDHCSTPMGRRLLKTWLCHPLRKIDDINQRLDAIEDLTKGAGAGLRSDVVPVLRKLGDLDRLVSAVHSRRCPLPKFLALIDSLDNVMKLDVLAPLQAARSGFKSALLRGVTAVRGEKEGGLLEDMRKEIGFFRGAFDWSIARSDHVIQPNKGSMPPYDRAVEEEEGLLEELQAILQNARDHFGDRARKIIFKDSGKELFQIEIPVKLLGNAELPLEYKQMSSTKLVKRFWTPDISRLVEKLERTRENKRRLLDDVYVTFLSRFDENYRSWLAIAQHVATLDCLLSLAFTASTSMFPMCRPDFVEGPGSVLDLRQAVHPCVASMSDTNNYIPNDTVLGGDEQPHRSVLLTGPNMGGKSTLLRQTCIAVIMAQLGSFVPAQSLRLSPVDRIFTRIGASDRLMAGQSTFMVELMETSALLRQATSSSLVILDELGRGTSTFDGYAIAYAVLHDLVHRINCLTLFSTHYHMLTDAFFEAGVAMFHMGCVVESGKDDVTFLYTLTPGICPKSYGLNVARLAGIPEDVRSRAADISRDFEAKSQWHLERRVHILKRLAASPSADVVKRLARQWTSQEA